MGVKEPSPGHTFLADLAEVVRSNNAGPYELTFNVMFPNIKVASKVKGTGILCPGTIAKLYDIFEDDVIACMWHVLGSGFCIQGHHQTKAR